MTLSSGEVPREHDAPGPKVGEECQIAALSATGERSEA